MVCRALDQAWRRQRDAQDFVYKASMDALLDPWAYIGLSGEFVDRVVALAQLARG